MRSSPSALGVLLALAACSDEPRPVECTTSPLTYDNFGEPFVLDWCRGCHSSALPAGMRQLAPLDVNFDTRDDVRDWSPRILAVAGTSRIMPPAGGPSDHERELLVEWLACGAR